MIDSCAISSFPKIKHFPFGKSKNQRLTIFIIIILILIFSVIILFIVPFNMYEKTGWNLQLLSGAPFNFLLPVMFYVPEEHLYFWSDPTGFFHIPSFIHSVPSSRCTGSIMRFLTAGAWSEETPLCQKWCHPKSWAAGWCRALFSLWACAFYLILKRFMTWWYSLNLEWNRDHRTEINFNTWILSS